MKVVEDSENIQDIELIDIEDIVPKGGNSLFLSCARAILYMSNKNPIFINALKNCCNIDLRVVKTDIELQILLRQRLCEYFCFNGIVCDKAKGEFYLREEYAKLDIKIILLYSIIFFFLNLIFLIIDISITIYTIF